MSLSLCPPLYCVLCLVELEALVEGCQELIMLGGWPGVVSLLAKGQSVGRKAGLKHIDWSLRPTLG
jgi:hypothetical protein